KRNDVEGINTRSAMKRVLVVVVVFSILSLAAAYPAYVYVDEPEVIEHIESPLTSERYDIRPRATKKNLIGPAVNGHMLKQPLLRFDILWRKFAPNSKRSIDQFI
ncbi:hypothetical protein PMAYCL1PPCAC_30649, partial [Pristionchus mayeri]